MSPSKAATFEEIIEGMKAAAKMAGQIRAMNPAVQSMVLELLQLVRVTKGEHDGIR